MQKAYHAFAGKYSPFYKVRYRVRLSAFKHDTPGLIQNLGMRIKCFVGCSRCGSRNSISIN